MRPRRLPALLLLSLLAGLCGCASYRAVNAPLERADPQHGYRPVLFTEQRDLGEVLLVLAFSGGGTRAASLSYGVLQELRDTEIRVGGERHRLLDEVDMITSVSGGSFTAAYYGLFGDRIFEDFEARFLKRNVQGQLLRQLLLPRNWLRSAFTFLDRTELAIRYYDSRIFEGATFADLERTGGPFLHINATDLSVGNPFTFHQGQFDLICSDLAQLEIARAVAASSAVPVLFSPVTLRNYAPRCEVERPAWFDAALAERDASPRRYYRAHDLSTYLDGEQRRYVHLVDGGIADNLGIRGPLDNVLLVGGLVERFELANVRHPKHLAIVVVNAANQPDQAFDVSAVAPSLASMMTVVSGVQIHRYNFETVELLRRTLHDWSRDMEAAGTPIDTHVIELSFDSLPDPEERHYFNNVKTSFFLADATVERLIDAGRRLLRTSGDFQRLVDALAAPERRSH